MTRNKARARLASEKTRSKQDDVRLARTTLGCLGLVVILLTTAVVFATK